MAKSPNRKQEILEVAFDLFSQQGYAATSIRQIAREIGIRESAIYNHYKSKEEIFLSILNDYRLEATSAVIMSDDLIEKLVSPYNFMKDFSKKLIILWNTKNERKFLRLLLMEQFSKIGSEHLSISSYLEEYRSIWWMIFDEMIKHRFIKNIDPIILADEFLTPLFLIRIEHLAGEEGTSLDLTNELVSKHVDFFWEAIRN